MLSHLVVVICVIPFHDSGYVLHNLLAISRTTPKVCIVYQASDLRGEILFFIEFAIFFIVTAAIIVVEYIV